MEIYEFEQNVAKVTAFMISENCCEKAISSTKRCYTRLREHLELTRQDYSPGEAERWLQCYIETHPSICTETRSAYHTALNRLAEVYAYGSVVVTARRGVYHVLKDGLRRHLDDFLLTVNEGSRKDLCSKCSRFLYFVQQHDVIQTQEITVTLVLLYCRQNTGSSKSVKYDISSKVGRYLKYLYSKGIVTYGVSIAMNCFFNEKIGWSDHCAYWYDIPESVHEKIRKIMQTEINMIFMNSIICLQSELVSGIRCLIHGKLVTIFGRELVNQFTS